MYQVREDNKTPDLPTISFTKGDAQEMTPGHDDPVVITIILANANLHRTPIDQGSSADILFNPAFDKLSLEEKDLKAYPDNLFGLGDMPIQPLGFISLYTTFRKGTKSRTLSVDYIVVDVMSVYNALIGRTTLYRLAVVVSTPHLCMKFPTAEGIATVKRDQKLVRKYYNESLNLKGNQTEKKSMLSSSVVFELGKKYVPNLEERGNLDGGLKAQLVDLLRRNSDLFLWKAFDMSGIDLDLMSHKIAVYPGSRPIQQKHKKYDPKRTQVVEEQVQALLEAGFIREVKYPLWLGKKAEWKSGGCVSTTLNSIRKYGM
ncbi:uncharacterized protein [Arachis hypogaea]|uniref:uncharacterized protein n=1 Tax=Arachis hypogaea TaxID=3818 RepID=UPI003B21C5DB